MSQTKIERRQPYNEDAEKAALGCMMLEPERVVPLAMVDMKVTPDTFYVPAHREVCQAIYAIMAEGGKRVPDLITVGEALRNGGNETLAGSFVEELMDAAPGAAYAEEYLDIIRQKHVQRQIIFKCMEIQAKAYEADRGDTLLRGIPSQFLDILTANTREDRTNGDIMAENIDRWERAHAGEFTAGLEMPPQWKRLNTLLCGLEPGNTLLAGRPSQGKTTVAAEVAMYQASLGTGVAFVTLDMTVEPVLARMQSRKAGVSLPKLKKGYAGQANLQKIRDATKVLSGYPLYVNDRDRSLPTITTWIRYMKIRHNIGLFILDYIQLVMSGNPRLDENENMRLTRVSQVLKSLSLELKIPFLLLSQLRRLETTGTKEKKEKRPSMSDLRGSGSLEQDASKIVMIYRDPDMEELPRGTPTWVEVAKHQNGETGAVEFYFRRNYFRFDEANPDFNDSTSTHETPDWLAEGYKPPDPEMKQEEWVQA